MGMQANNVWTLSVTVVYNKHCNNTLILFISGHVLMRDTFSHNDI